MYKKLVGIVVLTALTIHAEQNEIVLRAVLPEAVGKAHSIQLHPAKLPDSGFYNVYTFREPISPDNIRLARRIGTALPATEKTFSYRPLYTGKHYFLVTISNRQGKEGINYKRGTGPVYLEDRTPPPAPADVSIDHADGAVTLVWRAPPLVNPDGVSSYVVYRATSPETLGADATRMGTVEIPMSGNSIRFCDSDRAGSQTGMFYYTVSAVDAAGNRSRFGNVVKSAAMPDLAVNPTNTLRENKDISVSKTHPVCGQALEFSLRVWNRGMMASKPTECRVRIREEGKAAAEQQGRVERVEPGGFYDVSFSYTPRKIGECSFSFAVDSQDQVSEINEDNNAAEIKLHVVDKDYYFAWYGDTLNLNYANMPQANSKSVEEWQRRGAWACGWAGVQGKRLKDGYLEKARAGYSGVLVDEIGGAVEKIEDFLAMLPELKQAYPDFFVAIWCVGRIPEEVAQLVKDDVIDLLILELYFKNGSDFRGRLGASIEMARKSGCIEKTIVGLGSASQYANYSTPEEHIDFLEEQMKFIREKAPEMPGVGFYSSKTLPGVDVALDEMCFKYFIQTGENP